MLNKEDVSEDIQIKICYNKIDKSQKKKKNLKGSTRKASLVMYKRCSINLSVIFSGETLQDTREWVPAYCTNFIKNGIKRKVYVGSEILKDCKSRVLYVKKELSSKNWRQHKYFPR